MRLGNPIESLHHALSAALYRDLPDITYADKDWDAWRALSKHEQGEARKINQVPTVSRTRRPTDSDVEVIMFPQTWGSTALGYGGTGGAAMTPAYTVVVSDNLVSCVYFGHGRLAYRVDYSRLTPEGRENWRADLQSQHLVDCKTAGSRYVHETST